LFSKSGFFQNSFNYLTRNKIFSILSAAIHGRLTQKIDKLELNFKPTYADLSEQLR